MDLAGVAALDDQPGAGPEARGGPSRDGGPSRPAARGSAPSRRSTPRSERMIRLAPSSIAAQARSISERRESSRPRAALGGHEEHGQRRRLEPAPAVEQLEPRQLVVVQDRDVQRDLPARLGLRVQQVPLAAGAGEDRGDQLLADRVERGVGDLGEELLEVVEQRLGPVGEHGQRRIGAHRPDRLLAGGTHRADDELEVLQRVAEGHLAVQQRVGVGAGDIGAPRAGRPAGPCTARSHLPYGLRRGELVLQLLVVDDPPCWRSTRNILPGSSRPFLTIRSGAISRAPTSEAMITRSSSVTT